MVPKSVVSIHTRIPDVSWVRLTRDLVVDDWRSYSLVDDKKQLKYDHALYQPKVWELCRKIPTASLYLFEEAPLRVNNSRIIPALSRCYFEAASTTILNLRHNYITPDPAINSSPSTRSLSADNCFSGGTMKTPDNTDLDAQSESPDNFKHHVYKIKPNAVSDYFSLLVGGERTSSLTLLRQIQNGTCEAAKGLIVDEAFWCELLDLPRQLQEQRMQPLLVAVAFYKLLTHVGSD